ncbi:helix-turn-helix domain-containing protein, partial [Staphylococcus hominis]|uniref:helix-turn-helix domain-containing protein n=1 Tax=Staphylococcus hominis TaxID=1290 RepID=UPI00119D52E6
IVDLKPRVLDFLTKIVEKAKEIKDFSIAFKKKELAELAGKDTRTVSRYLSELEEKDIIQTKGVRGRAGGTVIVFNTKLIRFDTSDKAFINSDEPISIDDIVEKKMPKKEKEPKKKTRNRRTKQQMIEAKILRSKEQEELDKLNKELKELGGVPTWDWFKKTDDPVGNYRTYLLSRLYNRYAALFTDRHN